MEITNRLENKANKLSNTKFKKVDEYLYEYKHFKGTVSTINLLNKSCTCHEIVDKGICLHLIKKAIIQKYRLPGMVSLDKFSIRKMRKKVEKNKRDESSSSFSESEHEDIVINQNLSSGNNDNNEKNENEG